MLQGEKGALQHKLRQDASQGTRRPVQRQGSHHGPATTCMNATLHGDCMQYMTDCIRLHGKAGTGTGNRNDCPQNRPSTGLPQQPASEAPAAGSGK